MWEAIWAGVQADNAENPLRSPTTTIKHALISRANISWPF
jgi:hypothetical protein